MTVSSYDMVLDVEPENVLAQLNKGLALHYLQRYDEAVSCYDKILQKRPENALTLYNKASSLVCQNRVDEGLAVLKRAIRNDFTFKHKARLDVDFESIRKTSEFKKLVL